MSSSAPVPPAPEIVLAEAAKDAPRPPYVVVPEITNPKLTAIPEVDRFLVLCDGEKVVKSWRVRVRRPKFPIWLLLLSFVPLPLVLLYSYDRYRREMFWYENRANYEIYRTPSKYDDSYSTPRIDDKFGPAPNDSPTPDFTPGPVPAPYDSPADVKPPDFPRTEPGNFPESFKLLRVAPQSPGLALADVKSGGYIPHAPAPLLAQSAPTPVRPRYFSLGLLSLLLFFFLPAILIVLWFFVFALRGHTFLYLTNRRVIVVELEQNILSRQQTVLNYTLENVAGFTLFAQRGLKKLFWVILLKEKRTFYLAIVTRTLAQFSLGAMNTFRSKYEPGLDAVAVCAELDALVLGLKAGLPPK